MVLFIKLANLLFLDLLCFADLLEDSEEGVRDGGRLYFLGEHGQFVGFDVLLKVAADRKAKHIAVQFVRRQYLHKLVLVLGDKCVQVNKPQISEISLIHLFCHEQDNRG